MSRNRFIFVLLLIFSFIIVGFVLFYVYKLKEPQAYIINSNGNYELKVDRKNISTTRLKYNEMDVPLGVTPDTTVPNEVRYDVSGFVQKTEVIQVPLDGTNPAINFGIIKATVLVPLEGSSTPLTVEAQLTGASGIATSVDGLSFKGIIGWELVNKNWIYPGDQIVLTIIETNPMEFIDSWTQVHGECNDTCKMQAQLIEKNSTAPTDLYKAYSQNQAGNYQVVFVDISGHPRN